MGIPPDGYVCEFTVGRQPEISDLNSRLLSKTPGAVLLKANYGAGKTHLLRFIKEKALQEGFAVSTITLDAKSAVRFNRMDQIIGAIFRGIEYGWEPVQPGIRSYLDLLARKSRDATVTDLSRFWTELTNGGKWDYSPSLSSPALFIALRAWAVGDDWTKDLIEDWLHQPWAYSAQRKRLYTEFVERLRGDFRDPRTETQFYIDDVFSLHVQGYNQCWSILRDLQRLTVESGLKGLVLLFDEFEDILNNITNIQHQQAAFWNLFQLHRGQNFNGISFFAVTPEFVHKCKSRLLAKGYWDYDFSIFEELPTFQMSPLQSDELTDLAYRIIETHGTAYGWEPDLSMKRSQLVSLIHQLASSPVEDRGRLTIKGIVQALDDLFDRDE